MSTMVTELLGVFSSARTINSFATSIDGTLTLFLLTLLFTKEILRNIDNPKGYKWMQTLDIAIVPLLYSFGYLSIIRMIQIMR